MKIKRIKIENFRSIKKTEIFPSDFNVEVGQNNHGKTNFFEAINWFYNTTSSPNEIKLNTKKIMKFVLK